MGKFNEVRHPSRKSMALEGSRWKRYAVSIAAMMIVGCPNDEMASLHCEEPEEAQPQPEQHTPLTFELALGPEGDSEEVADPLVFNGASGLEPRMSAFDIGAGNAATTEGWSALELAAGPDDVELAPLWKWCEQVLQQAYCDIECEKSWHEVGPTVVRTATLTIKTDDDIWLARWQLESVWPTSMLLDAEDQQDTGAVVTLSLAASGGRTTYNPDHPIFEELREAYSVTGDENGIEIRDTERGIDFFLLRSRRSSIAQVLGTLEDASEQAELPRAIRKFNTHKGDYAPAANFNIEIDGVIQGGFKEITGLESEVEVIEYRDGDATVTQKRPGRPKFKNIVLKRGQVNAPLLEWYKKVLTGTPDRRTGSIIYIDRDGAERRYNITSVAPVRWMDPEAVKSEGQSESDGYAVEEVEFVVERVERA